MTIDTIVPMPIYISDVLLRVASGRCQLPAMTAGKRRPSPRPDRSYDRCEGGTATDATRTDGVTGSSTLWASTVCDPALPRDAAGPDPPRRLRQPPAAAPARRELVRHRDRVRRPGRTRLGHAHAARAGAAARSPTSSAPTCWRRGCSRPDERPCAGTSGTSPARCATSPGSGRCPPPMPRAGVLTGSVRGRAAARARHRGGGYYAGGSARSSTTPGPGPGGGRDAAGLAVVAAPVGPQRHLPRPGRADGS